MGDQGSDDENLWLYGSFDRDSCEFMRKTIIDRPDI